MQTGFKSVHPISAFAFYVFAFLLSMTASHPFFLAVSFIAGLVYDIKLSGKKAVSFLLKVILPLVCLITLFNGIFSHYGVTVLFEMHNGNNFTLEALVFGFVFSVRTSSALLWLNSFNEIITSDKFIFLFGRVSPKIALVISMVLRFIPLVRSQSEEIKKAEMGAGNLPTDKDFFGKVRHGTRRLSILISWTLEKGIDTADSMKARGYGLHARTSYNNYRFNFKDALFMISTLIASGIYVFVGSNYKANYNPVIDIPMPDALSSIFIIFIASVLLLPTLYDLREDRKWSISK
ncbi:MAG: energy-coupling factor transporter transmembrane protein EcfT [Ruminococcaceae bacterium]|nr:energy-coupling factor transporter transmembrane protein EcfT [Oscillospiraceae bacterium]